MFGMDLDTAIAILNANRHHGCDRWRPYCDGVRGRHEDDIFTAFEAIAIAGEYRWRSLLIPKRQAIIKLIGSE